MIAVDSSAIIAIFKSEADKDRLYKALENSDGAIISAANVLELQLVLSDKRALAAWNQIEAFFVTYSIAIHPFEDRQLRIAREAAVKYGRGRHKAGLNYGDCFAYALAKSEGLPLLCTGSDFKHTDLKLA